MAKPVPTDLKNAQQRGQSLVEYALILSLLAVAFGFALAATGPAIGNVFCNVVDNLGGEGVGPQGICGEGRPPLNVAGGNPNLFWATVTWVAENRQQETPFPTPVNRPPTNPPAIFQTPTHTYTPSLTPTSTNTPTLTPSPTPTTGPSATPDDLAFSMPHIDQIGNPEWWRLDNSTTFFLGEGGEVWNAVWYDDTLNEWDANNWSLDPASQRNSLVYAASELDFDWGDGYGTPAGTLGYPPNSGITHEQDWGGVFTRTFNQPAAQDVTFRLCVNGDRGRFFVNGTLRINRTSSGCSNSTVTLPAGATTLAIEYQNLWNRARMSFTADIPDFAVNPSDTVAGCPVGISSGANTSNSPTNYLDENPSDSNWTTNGNCHLELRGFVDISSATTPIFSFWDVWDFLQAGNVTSQIQVANYITDVGGAFDQAATWAGGNVCSFNLHGAGTRNYNWTRHQLDLRDQCPGLGNQITFRFVIGSTDVSGNSPFRWRVDDIQLLDEPTPLRTFTIGDQWDMNNVAQLNDFLFNADSSHNINTFGLPQSPSGYRWNLVSPAGNRARSGMALTQNNDNNYATTEGQNAYTVEFKYPIDLTASPLPADAEGDVGDPILSFWLSHRVELNTAFLVEYTTNPRNRTGGQTDDTPDDWQTIPNEGVIINFTDPAGAPLPNEQTPRNNLNTRQISVSLAAIPGWDTAPFRLRFAFYVNTGAGTQEGVYIDDVRIERENNSPYFVYPFFDDSEDPIFTTTAWEAPLTAQGQSPWGQTSEVGGVFSNPSAYSDSPSSNYSQNRTWTFDMLRYIDLMNDSPLNITDDPARLPAIDPTFSFWHRRNVGDNAQLYVDAQMIGTSTWTQVWVYNSASGTGSPAPNTRRRNEAWERIEVSIPAALQTVTGSTWATIQSNGDQLDDDIRFRFRFVTAGSSTNDGVYVDDIRVDDGIGVHRLWAPAAGGDGIYPDNVSQQETFDPGWWNRFFIGGDWNVVTSQDSFFRSAPNAIADSPTGNSRNYTFAPLEISSIIDLTNTTAAQFPMLRFWTRYNISNNHNLRVQVASENVGSLTQSWNQIGGWNAWQDRQIMAGVPQNTLTNTEVRTWQRAQVDLSPFAGSRVRIRFVMDTPSNSSYDDGVYIDDLSVVFGTRNFVLPFPDSAQTMINWVSEGMTGSQANTRSWGLDPTMFIGSGAAGADLGPSVWEGFYFDCELNGFGSCSGNTYRDILDANPNPVETADLRIMRQNPPVSDINFFWGGGRPMDTISPTTYENTFTARFRRTVTLEQGSYTFQTVSDDGVRVYLDNYTGTNFGNVTFTRAAGPYIINSWQNQGPTAYNGTITVTSSVPITRTLTVEYYENGGGAVLYLGATRSSFSFSDSPNIGGQQNSAIRGNYSLVSDGFFNLAATGPSSLRYQRLWNVRDNQRFYVEYSTDGGFTWTTINSENLNNSSRGVTSGWQQRNVDLTSINSATVMLRFRMDTRTLYDTNDGVWITDILLVQN